MTTFSLSLTTLIKICYSKNLEQKVRNIKFYPQYLQNSTFFKSRGNGSPVRKYINKHYNVNIHTSGVFEHNGENELLSLSLYFCHYKIYM